MPTRLHILSDLHVEFGAYQAAAVEADVVVLAGDIGVGTEGLVFARQTWPDLPIVYVAGNHEYYGHRWPASAAEFQGVAEALGIEFLHRRAVVIAGVQFLGATLWTDLRLKMRPRRASTLMRRKMNDYRLIWNTDRRLLPTDTLRANLEAQIWLAETLDVPFEGPRVIVTHHAPIAASLGAQLQRRLAVAYASRLEASVAASEAALWIHGHIHHATDSQCGATRVLCNPRGYPDDPAPGFDPGLVVEVP